MGKGSRLRRKNSINSSSPFEPCNGNGKDEKKRFQCTEDKDDQISQPCKRCADEMFKLRELNERLIQDINTSRQDLKACFSRKVEEMESQIYILQAASTNFETKIDNQFAQEDKIGEQLSDQLMEIDMEFRQHLAMREQEYEAGISKASQQLQDAEERFTREISEKEKECRAVFSEKQTLESSVLQLTNEIKVISADFEAAHKAWELEKDGFFFQIAAARKEAEEIAESRLIAEQKWNKEKENLLFSLGRTYEKKIEDMSALNQRVLFEKIELESQLNESKQRTRELLEKLEDDRHLWDSEKQKLQGNTAELQAKIDSLMSEGGLLCKKNRALCDEVESLKTQLNENITRIAQMQDERVEHERVLQKYRTESVDMQSSLNDSKAKTQDLLRKIEQDMHLWDAEKNNLKGVVAELRAEHELMASEMGSLTLKNRELTVEAELTKSQVNALEFELNECRKSNLELQRKNEDDWHLWDKKRRNLESTLAELQVKHEDLMLQFSRKKAFEEELLLRMSFFEEMKESISKGEIKIANLRSQLLAVADEKDGKFSDIGQLSAMAEEQKSQLVSLEDQLSSLAEGKMILEEENKSLQSALDRRTLVAEKEKVRLEDRVRELQTTFNSLHKELESSRAIAWEKERQFVDLQNRHTEVLEAKRCLENKNESLLTEIGRCTMVSDENIRLQKTIGELEMAVESLKKDIETKQNRPHKLMLERQPPWRIPLAVPLANGKPKRNVMVNESVRMALKKWMEKWLERPSLGF